jgi:hypothetical protein
MPDDNTPASAEPLAPENKAEIKRRKIRLQSYAAFLNEHDKTLSVLSTLVTAIFTVVLATSTVFLWKETKDLRNFAEEQGADMKASIAEQARAANAMRDVALAVGDNARAANNSLALFKDQNVRQTRAYLTVNLGGVVQQDNTSNYRFEIRMLVQNVGNTPAYRVASNTHVGILPFPLPVDFEFPQYVDTGASGIIGPHLNAVITGIADRMFSDDELHELEFGDSKQLYIYGIVKYQDAFDAPRQTEFCDAIRWMKNGTFMTLNAPRFNDAD